MNNNELCKHPFDDLSIAQNIQVQIVKESDELQKIDSTLNTYIINNLRFNLIDKKNKLKSSINHLVKERDNHLNKSISSALDIFDNEVDNNTISYESLGYKALTSIASFVFSVPGFTSIHRKLFEGIFKFAGKIRNYDITKKEWVLRGDTVLYVNSEDLRRALEYDLEQEKDFSYKGLSMNDVVAHIAKFVSGIW